MAKLGTVPIFQCPNGSEVYTYTTGTTTLKATYHETGLVVKNRNPFLLDSMYGRKVYMLEDSAYRFVIKDSAGSTLHTVDDVNPIVDPSSLTSNLNVNGNSIVSSSAGDISFTPNGPGYLTIDGLKWTRSDGTTGQVLSTDGAGTLEWINNGTFWLPDTTPQLGGVLDANTFSIKFKSGSGFKDDGSNEQIMFTTTSAAVNQIDIGNAATGTGPNISATGDDSDIDLVISPKGSAPAVLDGIKYPTVDGTTGQLLVTDGGGVISMGDSTSDIASDIEISAASGGGVIAPASQHHHPLVPKVVAYVVPTGTYLHGVGSLTNVGTHVRVNFAVAMASADYCVSLSTNTGSDRHLILDHQTTTYIDLKVRDTAVSTSYTPRYYSLTVHGEQA